MKQKIVPTLLLVIITFLISFICKFTSPVNAAPPVNFQRNLVVGVGLDGPSGLGIAPDGRLFILERTGAVKIYKNGELLAQPFTTLPSISSGDRGLIGVEFDPDFFNNHYVYFYYTGLDGLNRLVRFDASQDVAVNGPLILYETKTPSEQLHVGGSIQFGPDGKIYFAVGDNGYAPNAQDLSNPHGKILRINKDGSIPSDNPFVGQTGKLPEIWAYGFRNPWRFQFDKITGFLFGGDVGEATWEEVNRIVKGGNYGHPILEGTCPTFCPYINPIYTYNHDGLSSAITGGPVYRNNMFPPEYYGRYFFGDYARGFIKTLTLDSGGNATGVEDFDLNAGSVVDIKIAPDGSLYYVTYIPGVVYRITYFEGNQIPVANSSADITKGVEPLTVHFSSAGSYDPDADAITFLWDFGDGTSSTENNPTKVYGNKGKFIVQLTVSDGVNSSIAVPIIIQVGIAPTITIGSPDEGNLYLAGEVIFYSANAVDGAGFDISEADMTTEVVFHHGSHIHPFLGPVQGKTGTFAIPESGEWDADQWYEIIFKATDTNGLSTSGSVNIFPTKVDYTFAASTEGLDFYLDGRLTNTPLSLPQVVNFQREVSAIAYQNLNGNYYLFQNWSDEGPARHTITIPDSNFTLTANHKTASAFSAAYFNNTELSGSPVFTRSDPAINYDWGDSSPDPRLPSDGFSVRWTVSENFAPGRYKFTTSTDDGVRLFIDNNLLINKWIGQPTTSYEAVVDLTAGTHELKMEYFDSGGGAVAKLNWEFTADQPTTPGPTPTPTPVPVPTDSYKGEYWNVPGTGSAPDIPASAPALIRADNLINFVWDQGSPDPVINADHFVARWTKTQSFDQGTYRFTTETDDGVRLYVDDSLVIDKWIDQGTTVYSADLALTPGNHDIQMEYYENGGGAVAKLSYIQISGSTPSPTPTTPPSSAGYRGEYYDNQSLSGTPKLIRDDVSINFIWDQGSPDPAIPADHFSVRWTRTIELNSGTYEFTTSTDDGVRLFIDNEILIDKWIDQGTTTYTASKALTEGSHTLVMEYYENGGGAVAILNYNKVADATSTPSPTPAPTTSPVYQSQYWNVPDTGSSPQIPTTTPDLTRIDNEVNFTWNHLSPDPVINTDHFVARWIKTDTFQTGTYRFTTETDDGVRLYIDDNLVLDKWIDQGTTKYEVDVSLTEGNHEVKVEYYENAGGAVAKVNYIKVSTSTPPPSTPAPSPGPTPTPIPTTAFKGEYWNTPDAGSAPEIPSTAPDLTRDDALINFVWNDTSPDPVIAIDHFVVRWTKTQFFAAGTYSFTLKSDDGTRFWVDDTILVDDWTDHPLRTYNPSVSLSEGDHTLKVEYYENAGGAVAILEY